MKVKRKIHLVRREHGRKSVEPRPAPASEVPKGRVPRISRLMALAIKFDRMIRDGTVKDMSELARLAHVTQPRMTQIMNLNYLAPEIQETLLFLPPVTEGRERVHERMLRQIAASTCWLIQRKWMLTRPLQTLKCQNGPNRESD